MADAAADLVIPAYAGMTGEWMKSLRFAIGLK